MHSGEHTHVLTTHTLAAHASASTSFAALAAAATCSFAAFAAEKLALTATAMDCAFAAKVLHGLPRVLLLGLERLLAPDGDQPAGPERDAIPVRQGPRTTALLSKTHAHARARTKRTNHRPNVSFGARAEWRRARLQAPWLLHAVCAPCLSLSPRARARVIVTGTAAPLTRTTAPATQRTKQG